MLIIKADFQRIDRVLAAGCTTVKAQFVVDGLVGGAVVAVQTDVLINGDESWRIPARHFDPEWS